MDEKIIKKCIEARHKLHQLAELSNDEIQTKIFLMEFLKKNSCLEIHDEGKWFYAVYKSKERGPGIAFRSEIDAVPVAETTDVVYKSLTDGVSHTCGHDGHCASLLSTALHIAVSYTHLDVYKRQESDNTVLFGAAQAKKRSGNKVLVSAAEHPAILEPARKLESLGYEVVRIGVDRLCHPDMNQLAAELTEDTILISIMGVNNETGTIMPISEIDVYKRQETVLCRTDRRSPSQPWTARPDSCRTGSGCPDAGKPRSSLFGKCRETYR